MNEKKYNIIHSLDKGLYLLEMLEQAGSPMTLQQLWLKLKWDKATIYRLLCTLEKRGYVFRNPSSPEYSLGLKIYALYDSLIRNLDLQQITKPFLVSLVRHTKQAAHLAVPVGKSVVFIDRMSGSDILSVNTQIGSTEPLHCTALGKAYLAFLPIEEAEELLAGPLARFTPRTMTAKNRIREELLKIKARGYAVDNEEYIDGIRCIAAPILNQHGSPIALVGISGPQNRVSLTDVKNFGDMLKKLALEISKKFGHGIGVEKQNL
jgi:DNA-binding IclR family transcriptional regulator